MLGTESLPRQAASLKLHGKPSRLNAAPATTHCNPTWFAHETSPSQDKPYEQVCLL
jgi:hypothetical protein